MRKRIVILVLLSFLAISSNVAKGQSVDQLKSEIIKAENEIARINALIKTNSQKLSGTNDMLTLVKKKIDSRQLIVRNLDTQISRLRNQLGIYGRDITVQTATLNDLIELQKRQLRSAYLNYRVNNYTSFLFDSQSFSQAVRRLYYLDMFQRSAVKRSGQITSLKQDLTVKVEDLTSREKELLVLLGDKASEVKSLERERKELALATSQLKSSDSKLKAQASANRKKVAQLQTKINQIIEQEARRAAAEAAKKRKEVGAVKADAEYQAQGRAFISGKGELVSPVAGGVVVEKFGIHQLPGQAGVKVDNKGVNVRCADGAVIRAIDQGEVRNVFFVQGMGSSVLIRHVGGYLSVYSNLSSVSVKQGDSVERGATIGRMNRTLTGDPILHFQIWRETQTLNPEHWIRF